MTRGGGGGGDHLWRATYTFLLFSPTFDVVIPRDQRLFDVCAARKWSERHARGTFGNTFGMELVEIAGDPWNLAEFAMLRRFDEILNDSNLRRIIMAQWLRELCTITIAETWKMFAN